MKGEYTSGLRDGLAIGVGYFSVSFTFGILAVNGGYRRWRRGSSA